MTTHTTQRKTPDTRMGSASIVMLVLFVASLGAWEGFWRSEQFTPSSRNSMGLWAMTRHRVEAEGGSTPALIGSSRTLFDINLDTWEEETGQVPIQLALEGTSPLPFLADLSADTSFSSLLIVGVTTPLFFFPGADFRLAALEHYRDETPSEWLGQRISMPLEKVLAFYNFDTALPTVLKRQLWWPVRDSIEFLPRDVRKLVDLDTRRHGQMWARLDNDTAYAQLAQSIWLDLLEHPPAPPPPEVARAGLDTLMMTLTSQVNAIRGRGGEVAFIRLPSIAAWRDVERGATPREAFWDRLLGETNAVGIHFEDYREMQDVTLPEWSHVTRGDTPRLTRAIIAALREQFEARGINRPELYR